MAIDEFIYSLMTDREKRPIFRPLEWSLLLISLIYRVGIVIRALFYRYGVFKTARLPMKLISVGNLTLGGTGKTPFVMMLARILKDEIGRETSVLIRGYGWDEQAMLKSNLPDVPVIVGEDRVRSAKRAIRLYGSEAAILDDGFQHWELERDLDIVLVDSRNPFGNGYLFPRGILREPRDSIRRADVVVFTKVNKKKCDIDIDDVKKEFLNMNRELIFLEAVHRPKYLCNIRLKKTHALASASGKRAILLSSIGDPEYFEDTVKDLGADVIGHLKFRDHYNYREKDVGNMIKIFDNERFDLLITTEKDSVKLSRLGLSLSDYPLTALIVEMAIVGGRETFIDRLRCLYSH